MYQTAAEHGVQLDLVILQDVLKGASGTVLGEEATMRSCDAGANEAHQMIVSHIFHLNEKERERGDKKNKKRTKATGWIREERKSQNNGSQYIYARRDEKREQWCNLIISRHDSIWIHDQRPSILRPYPLQFQQQRSIEFHFALGDRFDGHNHALDTPKEKKKKESKSKVTFYKVHM